MSTENTDFGVILVRSLPLGLPLSTVFEVAYLLGIRLFDSDERAWLRLWP